MSQGSIGMIIAEVFRGDFEIKSKCCECSCEVGTGEWEHEPSCERGAFKKAEIFRRMTVAGFTNIRIIRTAGLLGQRREVCQLTENGEKPIGRRSSLAPVRYSGSSIRFGDVRIVADIAELAKQ